MSVIHVPEDPNGCWDCLLSQNSDGYCRFSLARNRHVTYAHRVAYALLVGEIPRCMTIHHTCCNRRCCNPAHLELRSHCWNVMEAHRRARQHDWRAFRKANGIAKIYD